VSIEHLLSVCVCVYVCVCVCVCVDTGSVRIVQSPPGFASLGSRLLLSCSYAAADTERPVKVAWVRGRRRVEGNWFVIDSVDREDDGRYTCIVNADGHDLSTDAIVRVQCIRRFTTSLLTIHYDHCLHHLLPPKTSAHCRYSLRERQHSFQLFNIEFLQFKNSFVNRCLLKFR